MNKISYNVYNNYSLSEICLSAFDSDNHMSKCTCIRCCPLVSVHFLKL